MFGTRNKFLSWIRSWITGTTWSLEVIGTYDIPPAFLKSRATCTCILGPRARVCGIFRIIHYYFKITFSTMRFQYKPEISPSCATTNPPPTPPPAAAPKCEGREGTGT